MSRSSLENGNMSIREVNRLDGDGRDGDGWGEDEKERGRNGFTQIDERAGKRWNREGLS